jgi:hypothetical protein
MGIPRTQVSIKREQTGDPARDREQQAAIDTLKLIRNCPFLVNGKLVKNLAIASSDTSVNHGLGRPVQGYLVLAMRNAFGIIRFSTTQPTESNFRCNLVSSNGGGTYDIWFF